MKFPIGFRSESPVTPTLDYNEANKGIASEPVKSLVDIRFPTRNMTLAYYNDQFDLAPGDLVYVDGKLEGLLGHVVSVNRHFKIKLSDYKRVIAKVDTHVQGQLNLCCSHVVDFDRNVIPYSKVITCFKVPELVNRKSHLRSNITFTCVYKKGIRGPVSNRNPYAFYI